MSNTYGVAGRSAGRGGSWAANSEAIKAGVEGERKTAEVLRRFALEGASVFHDLRIPIPGISANIDHIVVSGRNVLAIDSKLWAPGFYWTVGGKTRRGMTLFPPADKKTMPMVFDALSKYLAKTNARILTPIVAVWPSTTAKRQTFLLATIPGAHIARGPLLTVNINASIGRPTPANPTIDARIRQLVIR